MQIPADVIHAKAAMSAMLLRPLSLAAAPAAFELSVAAAVERANQNVHAVGVGRKWVSGEQTTTPAVRIYVTQKLPLSLLNSEDRLPAEIDGIPTDVIESPPALLASTPSCSVDRRRRQRPVPAGISTAHPTVTAGTIGCFCRSTREEDDPSAMFVLSNNHVYADLNRASRGDPLLQPGSLDGGGHGDAIAQLERFVPIVLGGITPNAVDAAVGRVSVGISVASSICSIGPISGTLRAEEGMPVRKHGRTTGYTEGVVTDESYDAVVGMDHHNPSRVALFADQMRIERIAPYPAFGLGGDSGSLVVHQQEARAVGLFFAGPPSGAYGIANQIDDVLRELEITIA